jgi:hypothetical protein
MTFRRAAPPLALLATLICSLLGAFGAAPAPVAAADAPRFAILIDGLCSELPAATALTSAFTGADGLAARLAADGWPADSIVGFSYQGGTVDANGLWQPAPYSCADSRDRGLASDALLLERQVDALATAHPGAAFSLIGFSQGGAVAYAFLARYAAADGWALPAGGHLAAVATLDSPLGGLPFVDVLCSVSPETCGGSSPSPTSSLADFAAIWNAGSGHPAGADRSIAARIGQGSASNQALGGAAAAHGVSVLTVGNVRDWLYAPAGPDAGTLNFLDTQWLTTDPEGAGVYGLAIDSGPSSCAVGANLGADFGCNHGLVTRDATAAAAVVGLADGRRPAISSSCVGGRGGCISLPPRPSVIVSSRIAGGLVTSGGTFVTSAVSVPRGGRATLLITTSPALAGAHVQIWARTKTGAYVFVSSRVADPHGIVRYYTPPVTTWTAYQAKYLGDYVNGPGVSSGRVVTPR